MKKESFLMIFLAACAMTLVPSGCRMAPKDEPGDTVAASVFAPVDTAALNRKARAAARKAAVVRDSADIFYIGDGSTAARLQLVSYPSRRDTVVYGKTAHYYDGRRRFKKSGNLSVGHVVRVSLWVSEAGDTLVRRVEEIVPGQTEPGQAMP